MTIAMEVSELSYRVARPDDYDLLLALREECGWGASKVSEYFNESDRVWGIFEYAKNGQTTDVGMGCWILEDAEHPEDASRKLGNVYLDSLFIRNKYQGSGLGSKAMDLLEQVAVEKYAAKYVTLNTFAYLSTLSEDGSYFVENFGIPGRSLIWYQKRGYKQYKDIKQVFPHPHPKDPNRKINAMYLRKSADSVESEKSNTTPK